MLKDGKLNANNFWRMKSTIEKSKGNEPYDIITEEGNKLEGEEETKEYAANYCEQLYQAWPAKPKYQEKN